MLKTLLVTLAKNLVDNPDAVVVNEETREDGTVVLKLSVAPDDMGKVIGRQGKIAKALRTVIRAASTKENVKAVVEIV